jgi:hypothetical protein
MSSYHFIGGRHLIGITCRLENLGERKYSTVKFGKPSTVYAE